MLRGASLFLVMLGILICPFNCTGGLESAAASSFGGSCLTEEKVCGCGCSGSEEHAPTPTKDPCKDPCGRDCVCKAAVEGPSKLVTTLLTVSSPLDGNLLGLGAEHASGQPSLSFCARSATHPDLLSGVEIRVAFASLLL